jgi:hypothetical protein
MPLYRDVFMTVIYLIRQAPNFTPLLYPLTSFTSFISFTSLSSFILPFTEDDGEGEKINKKRDIKRYLPPISSFLLRHHSSLVLNYLPLLFLRQELLSVTS